MTPNPWSLLPEQPPFVLPADEVAIRSFNEKASENHKLRIDDILPEPFVGTPDAPVVLLGNNPGFKAERVPIKREAAFVTRLRDNLLHKQSDQPFVFFASDVDEVHRLWWDRKFKGLLFHFGRDVIARSVLTVEHFPYPSRLYGAGRLHLPSGAREYSYALVKNAMQRKALIVLTRGKKRWYRAVDGLESYPGLCEVRNPQVASISRGNCDRFRDIVQAIEKHVE